jgi:hypothetical protein
MSLDLSFQKTNEFKATQSGLFFGLNSRPFLLQFLRKKLSLIPKIRIYSQNTDFIEDLKLLILEVTEEFGQDNIKFNFFQEIGTNDDFQKYYQLQKWNNQEKQILLIDQQSFDDSTMDIIYRIINDPWLNILTIFHYPDLKDFPREIALDLDYYYLCRSYQNSKNESFHLTPLTRYFRFNQFNKKIDQKYQVLVFDRKKTLKYFGKLLLVNSNPTKDANTNSL